MTWTVLNRPLVTITPVKRPKPWADPKLREPIPDGPIFIQRKGFYSCRFIAFVIQDNILENFNSPLATAMPNAPPPSTSRMYPNLILRAKVQ